MYSQSSVRGVEKSCHTRHQPLDTRVSRCPRSCVCLSGTVVVVSCRIFAINFTFSAFLLFSIVIPMAFFASRHRLLISALLIALVVRIPLCLPSSPSIGELNQFTI